jgi:hypothetical protein
MIEGNHPAAVHLAHQPGVDAVLGPVATVEAVAADQLGGVRAQHLDADVEEMEAAAALGRPAIIADIMVERALPVALELPPRDEHHVGIPEARHVAAEIAAVPRRLHIGDHLPDRALLGSGIVGRRARAGGGRQQQGHETGLAHRDHRPAARHDGQNRPRTGVAWTGGI